MRSKFTPLQIVTAIAGCIALIWFLWPQLPTIIFTALMAYIFYPVFVWLRAKIGKAAAFTTLVISFLVVLLPITFIVIASIGQLISLGEVAGKVETWQHLPDFISRAVDVSNSILRPFNGEGIDLTEQSVLEFIKNTLPAIANAAIGILFGILASIPGLALAILIYVFVFIELLLNGPKLIEKIRAISPYDTKTTNLYLHRMGLMAKAAATGQLMISFIIAALSALILIPLGYGNYFFILLIVFTILNFMPLGSGVIVIPLALYAMATGQFWMGILAIILYYAVGWLDPVLRPLFIPKEIQLSSALMIVSVFCGIAYFGILGVVYGPIVLMLIITIFDLHIREKKKLSSKA